MPIPIRCEKHAGERANLTLHKNTSDSKNFSLFVYGRSNILRFMK